MKNKKGFTLVELLAVIVLLAVVVTIAVPSIMGISKKIKQNMLESKIEMILEAGKLYGQDHVSYIKNSTGKVYFSKTETYPCISIPIVHLIKFGYLKSDVPDKTQLINPVTNKPDLANYNNRIILYYKNKRVVTVLQDENFDGTNEYYCNIS